MEIGNIAQDCDDDVGQKNTHPNLLPKPEQDAKAQKSSAAVIGKTITGKLSDKQKSDM